MKVKGLKVLIIGLGDIAMGYDLGRADVSWTHVSAILKNEDYVIIGGVDPAIATHDSFYSLTSAPAYSDIDDFLLKNKQSVDLVVISSPTNYHLCHYKKIKSLQPKLVLMEKPLVAADEELEPLMAEIISGPRVMVNLFRLYQSKINSVLNELANNGPCRISIRYSNSIEHNGIHFITLILRHFGPCLKQELITVHNESAHSFTFAQADVLMSPAVQNVDDNSMVVHSSKGTTYYLNGGRIFFQVDLQHNRQDFQLSEFQHHMDKVYQQCLQVIRGKDDDSLALAHSGHQLLMKGGAQHEKLHAL